MEVLLAFHLLVTLTLIVVVLMQRTQGGALGIGGSSQGGMMAARSSQTSLERLTKYLCAIFLATSLGLALLAQQGTSSPIADSIVEQQSQGTVGEDGLPIVPLTPDVPAIPDVPVIE